MFKGIWDFLNGNKTKIGLVALAIVGACEQIGWLPVGSSAFLTSLLAAIGITVVGVGHKIYKAGEKKGFQTGIDSCQDESR